MYGRMDETDEGVSALIYALLLLLQEGMSERLSKALMHGVMDGVKVAPYL